MASSPLWHEPDPEPLGRPPAGFGHTEQLFLGRDEPHGWTTQR